MNRRNISVLLGALGARLGHAPDTEYTSERLEVEVGDRLVFYTDGIPELVNEDGKMFGDRKFTTLLVEDFVSQLNLDQSMESLSLQMDAHRGTAHLEDDVTYFMVEYNDEPSRAA